MQKPSERQLLVFDEGDNKICTVDINHVYDNVIKVGRAQYLAWLLCFITKAVEFGEIALLSVLIPILRCEWDLDVSFEAAITVVIYITYFMTVPVFGKVADIYGRRPLLILGNTLLAVAGLLSALAPNKWLFLLCRVFCGCGVGIIGSGSSLFLEITPNNSRVTCVTTSMVGVYFGKFLVALLAYFLLSSVGWRWITAIAGLPCILVTILTLLLPESPRYLIVSGEEDKAMEAIGFIAKLNRVSLPANLQVTVYKSESLGNIRDVFANNRTRDIISLSIILGSNLCVVYGLVVFLPLALTSNFCGVGIVNSTQIVHTCESITPEALGNLSMATFLGLLGTIVGALLSKNFGRLHPIRVCSLVQIGIIFLLYFCLNQTSVNLSAAVAVTGVVNCIEWIIIAEVFPTKVRATTISIINSFGKLGGIIGSAFVYVLLYTLPALLVTLFFVASVLCFVGTLTLNKETKNLLLSDVDKDSCE